MNDIEINSEYTMRYMYQSGASEIDGAYIRENGNKNQRMDVYIPEGAKVIKEGAFQNCANIVCMSLPKGLKQINKNAFSGCINLKKINFPDEIESIGRGAFKGCYMLREVDIPKKATCVSYECFDSCGITGTLTIPDKVEVISVGAFKNCTLIKNVKLGRRTDLLDREAFANCSALESIAIPSGMKYLEEGVFSGCKSLKSIYIPKGVYTLSSKAFKLCVSLESADIEEGVAIIASEAFCGCNSLKSIKIPKSVYKIKERAFSGCSSLEKVSIEKGVEAIGDFAFAKCSSLQEVILPESIKELGENIFSGCTALKRVILPKHFASPEWRYKLGIPVSSSILVLNAANLNTAHDNPDNDGNSLEKSIKLIREAEFDDKSGILTIPDGVEIIPSGAFCDIFDMDSCAVKRKYYAERISCIVIPRSVNAIASDAFSGCTALEVIEVDKDNEFYSSIDGVLTSKDMETLIKYPENKCYTLKGDKIEPIEVYWVPSCIKYIAPHAFDLASIKNLSITENVEEIGEMAFHLCENLKRVEIRGVQKIGRMAFLDCRELIYANLGLCNATSIPEYLFSGCSRLSSLLLPARTKSIEQYAFWKCSSLNSIVFPNTVKSLAVNSLCIGDDRNICVTLSDDFLRDRDKLLRAGLPTGCAIFSSTNARRKPVKVSELESCYSGEHRPSKIDLNCLSGVLQRMMSNDDNLRK